MPVWFSTHNEPTPEDDPDLAAVEKADNCRDECELPDGKSHL